MPSPFLGMDPYLEDPSIWPDFHHAFAAEIRTALNGALPAPFYARMEMRPELGIVTDGGDAGSTRRIIPDVLVVRHPAGGSPSSGEGVALLDPPRTQVSESIAFESLPTEPARRYLVEIRDAQGGHKLITLIEILSPSNKQSGPDRDAYAAQQSEVLRSDASLIEIDLLRAGRRVLASPQLGQVIDRLAPKPDYLVLVSSSWRRGGPMLGYVAYPFTVRDLMPCIGVPLTRELPELPLDLQHLFRRTYDGGPYRRGAVDYSRPPRPALIGDDAQWARSILDDLAVG